ncbi:hypothetical protein BMS3Bbin01_02897 [bacterium BMS3Bbin01]|nr:hypothetical protein BMS3Bbin01_02897 [bacterium BMS3Bbin01]
MLGHDLPCRCPLLCHHDIPEELTGEVQVGAGAEEIDQCLDAPSGCDVPGRRRRSRSAGRHQRNSAESLCFEFGGSFLDVSA